MVSVRNPGSIQQVWLAQDKVQGLVCTRQLSLHALAAPPVVHADPALLPRVFLGLAVHFFLGGAHVFLPRVLVCCTVVAGRVPTYCRLRVALTPRLANSTGLSTEANLGAHHPNPLRIAVAFSHPHVLALALVDRFQLMASWARQQHPPSDRTLKRTASLPVVATAARERDAHARGRGRGREALLQTPVARLPGPPGEREHSGGRHPPGPPPGGGVALPSPKRSRVVVCRGRKCPLRKGGSRLRELRCASCSSRRGCRVRAFSISFLEAEGGSRR